MLSYIDPHDEFSCQDPEIGNEGFITSEELSGWGSYSERNLKETVTYTLVELKILTDFIFIFCVENVMHIIVKEFLLIMMHKSETSKFFLEWRVKEMYWDF